MSRKTLLYLVALLSLLVAIPFSSAPARAAGEVTKITALTAFGCAPSQVGFDWSMTGTGGVTYRVNLVVTANGQTVMNEDDGTFVGSRSDNFTTYFANDFGPAVNAWPLPANTIETVTMNMRFDTSGYPLASSAWIAFNCTTGLIVGGGSSSGAGDFAGPPLPAGFVLKTITCNVAVYDAPGGKPVGSNAIKAGQTWYVNPTPKKDAAGKSWTEIFVAGFTNGYVPTSCVH